MSGVIRIGGKDPDPQRTQRLVLRALVAYGYPMTRLEAEVAAFGRTNHTATWVIDALRALSEGGYVERPRGYRKYKATERGRITANLLASLDEDAAERHPSNGGAA